MGYLRREEELFQALPEDRKANIEIVYSAYDSCTLPFAYLTMPVTTGKRFYDTLDRYGVKSIDELEAKRKGALRDEIIIPNIEEAKHFAKKVSAAFPLIVPGIFEARKQRWNQDEYMILWLRLLTNKVRELHLSEFWEYSNGGAIEFCRAMMLHYRFTDEREELFQVFDHHGEPLRLTRGVEILSSSIKDLEIRGHDTSKLRKELGQLAGIAMYLNDHTTDRHTYYFHTRQSGYEDLLKAISSVETLGVPIALN